MNTYSKFFLFLTLSFSATFQASADDKCSPSLAKELFDKCKEGNCNDFRGMAGDTCGNATEYSYNQNEVDNECRKAVGQANPFCNTKNLGY